MTNNKHEVNPKCECGIESDFQLVDVRLIFRRNEHFDENTGVIAYFHTAQLVIVLECFVCERRLSVFVNKLDEAQYQSNDVPQWRKANGK